MGGHTPKKTVSLAVATRAGADHRCVDDSELYARLQSGVDRHVVDALRHKCRPQTKPDQLEADRFSAAVLAPMPRVLSGHAGLEHGLDRLADLIERFLASRAHVDFEGAYEVARDCELRPRGPRPGLRVFAGLLLGLVGLAILTGSRLPISDAIGRWLSEGLVHALRLDHPDGLFDPPAERELVLRVSGVRRDLGANARDCALSVVPEAATHACTGR